MFVVEVIATCVTEKRALLYGKIKFLTSFNSRRQLGVTLKAVSRFLKTFLKKHLFAGFFVLKYLKNCWYFQKSVGSIF